ncbi:MAG TPA: GMC family oxidoreductase [Cryptosporangiaceae bacterium]|nr:GMC family oxidoreductase [Cryptosporangiaceae bacterium]
MGEHFDVVVIGSGFGGSVSALRLTEKGYRVAVLEAGRRFADDEFARTSWNLRRFLWAPKLGCYGIQRITLLKNAMILSGAGVGGGSLVYANTLYEPLQPFYDDPQWSHITDWRAELAPHYHQAKRMLGVTTYPMLTPADEAMRTVAEEMGVGDTFHPTPVGVYFGEPGREVPDPYFGGAGPARRGCLHCGACMTGCRHNAKNTLVKNYLYLAEQAGAQVLPLTTVTAVRPRDPEGDRAVSIAAGREAARSGAGLESRHNGAGYAIDTVRTGSWTGRGKATFTADQVVFAAGAMGTQKLLHAMRDAGHLPRLSARLGVLTRTNSEAILGATTPKVTTDYSRGVAITSSFHPDADTHVEPVRYGKGSNFMGTMQSLLVPGDRRGPRWLTWLGQLAAHPVQAMRVLWLRRWSERTVIVLVMQSLDNSLTTFTRRGLFGRKLTSRQGHGQPNPTYIPAGHEVAIRLAEKIGGMPGGAVAEAFDIPTTAHFLGGCAIGDSPETGVVDPYHRVYGHPGLHVVDGASISANLGVNPSLTIAAQAERAMAFWPNRGDPDPRPAVGEPYRSVAPVPPRAPTVPAGAPGELVLLPVRPSARGEAPPERADATA